MKARTIAARVHSELDGEGGRRKDELRRAGMLFTAYMAVRRDRAAPISGADAANMMVLEAMAATQSGDDCRPEHYMQMAGNAALGGELAHEDARRRAEKAFDEALSETLDNFSENE